MVVYICNYCYFAETFETYLGIRVRYEWTVNINNIRTPRSMYMMYKGYGKTRQTEVNQVPIAQTNAGRRCLVGFLTKRNLSQAISRNVSVLVCRGMSWKQTEIAYLFRISLFIIMLLWVPSSTVILISLFYYSSVK